MKFSNATLTSFLAAAMCLLAPMAMAQQDPSAPAPSGIQQPAAPIGSSSQGGPAAPGGGVSSPDSADTVILPRVEPDNHPLTGAELYSVGSAGRTRDIFDPTLFFIESGTLGYNPSNPSLTPSSTQLSSITTVGGSLSVSRLWSHYSLLASYNGVGNFYQGQITQQTSNQTQSLGLSQLFDMGRWSLRVRNDFLYSPQTAFGDQSLGGPGLIGQVGSTGVLGGLNPTFTTGQTIQTGLADRVSDTALGEIDYSLNRRAQITISGSYALLRFIQPGFLNSHDVRGQVGYSYAMNPKDTLGISASYDRTIYQTGVSIQDSLFNISWGRRVTGRLAFQSAAGASLIHFGNFVPAISQRWAWTASMALTYTLRRNDFSLSYAHTVSDGSGVLVGTATHTLTASAVHHFTRFTSAGLNGGYTNSTGLVPSLATVNSFHGWYGGVNLNRQVGRHLNATLNYGAQRQTAGAGTCPVVACSPTTIFQTFGINLAWHPRSIELE